MKLVGKQIAFSVLFLWVSGFTLIGDWKSFTHLDKIQCAQEYQGYLFVGTTGGIRRIDPKGFNEKVYNNPADGLRDVDVVGFVAGTEKDLWAVSKDGLLYHWTSPHQFETIDRGLKNENWSINLRAMTRVGDYLVMGSSKGLIFYSIKKEEIEFSITNFGTEKNISITSVLVKGNELYIGTSRGVYNIKVYWGKPQSPVEKGFPSLFNPAEWKNVTSEVGTASALLAGIYQTLVYRNGSVQAYPSGTYLESPVKVETFKDSALKVDGKSYPSITSMEVAAVVGGELFLGDSVGIYHFEKGKINKIENPMSLPQGYVFTNVRGYVGNGYLWGVNATTTKNFIYKLTENEKVETIYAVPMGAFTEPYRWFMKSLRVTGENDFYLGTWGGGMFVYDEGVSQQVDNRNSCLTDILPNYTIVFSSALYVGESKREHGVIMGVKRTLVTGTGAYQLAYYDSTSQKVTCFELDSTLGKSIVPKDIQIIRDSILIVSHDIGIDLFRINDVFSSSGLEFIKHVYNSSAVEPQILGAVIDQYGRLWAGTGRGVYTLENVLENDDDSLVLFEALSDKKCTHVLKDGQEDVWMGCEQGLIHIKTSEQFLAEDVIVYTNREGLLTNAIQDFDIDPITGKIWVSTLTGINSFESSGRQSKARLNSHKVYPNPFLKHHEFVLFDNLTEQSEVLLFTKAGTLVYKTKKNEIEGGQWRWLGVNRAGRKVVPGVYYYVIKSERDKVKGKIIVGR